jgi:SAM-dependent methyltransferase
VGVATPSLREKVDGGLAVAADLTREMLLEFGRARGDVPLVQLDATRLPFEDGSFDIVYCAFMMQHVREQHRTLAEISRVLRPDGILGMATWDRNDPGCPAFEAWEETLADFGAPEEDPDPAPRFDEAINSEERLRALMISAELDIRRMWTHVPRYAWTIDSLEGCRLSIGAASRRYQKIRAARRDRFRSAARARLEQLRPDDFVWRPPVILTLASKAAASR